MMKLVGHPITWLFDRCTYQFDISRFLAKAEVDFWCIYSCMLEIKNTWDGMDTTLSKGRTIRKVTGDGGEFSSSMNFFSLMCPLNEYFFLSRCCVLLVYSACMNFSLNFPCMNFFFCTSPRPPSQYIHFNTLIQLCVEHIRGDMRVGVGGGGGGSAANYMVCRGGLTEILIFSTYFSLPENLHK